MKRILGTMAMAGLLASCASTNTSEPSASAPMEKPDAWTVELSDCADIVFNPEVIERFPEIGEACRGVVRDGAGRDYVKVTASVDRVRRDLNDGRVKSVTLNMLDPTGNELRRVSTKPPRDFRFTVDGQSKTAEYLARGEDLNIYFPTDRWEVAWDIDTATPLDTKVFIEDIESFLLTTDIKADEGFEFDSDKLSENGKASLRAVTDAAGEYVPSVTIFGYTDSLGADAYNLDLSQRRADAARDYLVSLGVPAKRISAVGRGEANPIVTCEGVDREALKDCLTPNRRTEVMFLVPAVADLARIEVTKTYVKPLGEKVTVVEELGVAQLTDASGVAAQLLDTCEAEITNYCQNTRAGDGRILGCLVANKQAGYEYSADCTASLTTVVDTVMSRRSRMNAVGDSCSRELAMCDSAPIGTKLQCVEARPKSDACAQALATLATSAF